jgi:diguanylate cyclase (GGDEF)-like protein
LNTALALLTLGLWTLLHANLASTTRARLRRSVSTDMLTGLMNRRSWLAAAADLRHRAEGRSRPRPLSILIADVDHLKLINDRHGNQVGDQVLGAVGSALQKGVREADLLARWGDDRFIVLISGSDGQAARMVGERLRALAQACMLRVGQEGEILPVSISLGGSRVEIAEPLDSAIARAESALGEAKQAGRNRVAMART